MVKVMGKLKNSLYAGHLINNYLMTAESFNSPVLFRGTIKGVLTSMSGVREVLGI